jgi:2-polyprenyl-6-methoxyphenol hydroxylase-like FAD-dependent oxidoreductase
MLRALGLLETLEKAGARRSGTAAFTLGGQACPVRELPQPALCLSRHVLDATLANRFRGLGGDLHCGRRWSKATNLEGQVRATGRRVQPETDGWRWFGLKAHARNVPLAADLEMHFAANSYVGLCRLPDGEINVCGLFRRKTSGPSLPGDSIERLQVELPADLLARMEGAEWDPLSFCSVGGLPFRAVMKPGAGEFCVGDALVMTPPITGNGMSMAFESAGLAVEPLIAYSTGRISWSSACEVAASISWKAFRRRLRVAGWLHAGLFHSATRLWLRPCVGRSDFLWRLLFRATR